MRIFFPKFFLNVTYARLKKSVNAACICISRAMTFFGNLCIYHDNSCIDIVIAFYIFCKFLSLDPFSSSRNISLFYHILYKIAWSDWPALLKKIINQFNSTIFLTGHFYCSNRTYQILFSSITWNGHFWILSQRHLWYKTVCWSATIE